MTRKPTVNPNTGEVTMGTTTFHSSPLPSHQCSLPGMDQMMTLHLLCAAARHAPQSPPTSACDELDGNPNHHVMRFHTIPPSNAQTMISEVTILVSTRPDAIVLATAVPQSAPSKFVKAASTTA